MEVSEINKTEQQILNAAYRVFQRRGNAGARMQEIADEANINKSMLHYYFRNKESLFKKVFLKSLQEFLGTIIPVMNDADTSWKEKITILVKNYLLFIKERPELPVFVLNEINQNPDGFFEMMKMDHILLKTYFFEQLSKEMDGGRITRINPIHVFVNIMSLVLFPFIASPMIKRVANLSDKDWNSFIDERAEIITTMIIKYLDTN